MPRPVDLAREHGLPAQAIRNDEDAGILPPAVRTDTGYRRYTPLHARARRTFLAVRRGHGYQRAMEIMRAINRGDTESAYRLVTPRSHDNCVAADTSGARSRGSSRPCARRAERTR